MKNKIIFSIILLCSLFLTTCGIEEYFYLDPPTDIIDGIGDTFQFTNNNSSGDAVLLGYEIYYKIFSSSLERLNFINSFDDNENPDFYSLTSEGFKRLYIAVEQPDLTYEADEYVPLFFISDDDRDEDFDIILNFDNLHIDDKPFPIAETSNPLITIDRTETLTQLNLCRYVNVNQVKSFLPDDFLITDSDIDFGSSFPENTIYIAFYVLAYGKVEITTTIYSEPKHLGNMDINLNP